MPGRELGTVGTANCARTSSALCATGFGIGVGAGIGVGTGGAGGGVSIGFCGVCIAFLIEGGIYPPPLLPLLLLLP